MKLGENLKKCKILQQLLDFRKTWYIKLGKIKVKFYNFYEILQFFYWHIFVKSFNLCQLLQFLSNFTMLNFTVSVKVLKTYNL